MFLFARQIDGGIFIGMACEKACLLIYGVGCLFGRDALDAARDRLQAIEAECQDERDTVRQWIDSVSDSMTRRALRLRYLDGKSWSECARRMGYADESGPRKLVERYLRIG